MQSCLATTDCPQPRVQPRSPRGQHTDCSLAPLQEPTPSFWVFLCTRAALRALHRAPRLPKQRQPRPASPQPPPQRRVAPAGAGQAHRRLSAQRLQLRGSQARTLWGERGRVLPRSFTNPCPFCLVRPTPPAYSPVLRLSRGSAAAALGAAAGGSGPGPLAPRSWLSLWRPAAASAALRRLCNRPAHA